MTERIHLSKADVTQLEEQYVLAALRSGWVAPLGPDVDAFEYEIAQRVGVKHALALSSGTAALHLALLHLGARRDRIVVLPTMTFAASANAVAYTGAEPVFVDSQEADGNIDPELLLDAIDTLRAEGRDVAAAMTVDLFGRACAYDALEPQLYDRGVPLLEDAAEALGTTYKGRHAGSFGTAAALSFNGNKIMTTSGGGMLLSDDTALMNHARKLSTQAREPVPWYEHTEIGYNYRLSNILGALGRAQLSRLDDMMARRREIRQMYRRDLAEIEGVRILGDEPSWDGMDNGWLTCVVLENQRMSAANLITSLNAQNIEARFLWKPMHLQRAFSGSRHYGADTAARLFESGVTLPSGSALTDGEIERVITAIRRLLCE